MGTKAIYESRVLKPLEELNLEEGEIVEVEVKKIAGKHRVDGLVGLLGDIDSSSLDLQHKIKEIWAGKSVSY